MVSGEGSTDVCLNNSTSLVYKAGRQAGSRRKKSACNECVLFDDRGKEVNRDGSRRTNARENE
jgi:hypothetical protein